MQLLFVFYRLKNRFQKVERLAEFSWLVRRRALGLPAGAPLTPERELGDSEVSANSLVDK